MKDNFEPCFQLVLKSEGGYVWDGSDPGGETNRGVTKAAWQSYIKRPVLEGEMAKLSVNDVRPFYKQMYWNVCNCEGLPKGVDYVVFDFAVNSGCKESIRTLQKSVGSEPDGVLGPITLTLISHQNEKELIDSFTSHKIAFYQILKTFPIYGKGWVERANRVANEAKEMV